MAREDRRTNARLGGLTRSGAYDGREMTLAARKAFLTRFIVEAEEDARARGEIISEAEARRRGEARLKAHMLRLATASAKARAPMRGNL